MGTTKGSATPLPKWRWRRWIRVGEEEQWLGRLAWLDFERVTFTGRPNAVRQYVEVYGTDEAEKRRLLAEAGGRAEAVKAAWMRAPHRPKPLRVTEELFIVDQPEKVSKCERAHPGAKALCVPADIAFGTGEHETTGMAMREMARRSLAGHTVLDAGTGAGLLALVARALGAERIDAFDFDPDCVRIAARNEEENYGDSTITWKQADVAKWPARQHYDLVVANLFSELLIANAKRLAGWVASGGRLIATGIFVDQEKPVAQALLATGLERVLRRRRGRWVMLVFRRSIPKR